MYHFHASILPRAADAVDAALVEVSGLALRSLGVTPEGLGALSFPRSFEEVISDLGRLPRLFAEPDGSFVWVSSRADVPWQLDGMIYDHQSRVRLIDVQGSCPPDAFDQMLQSVGWPACAVMLQLARPAVCLDENEFRRYASRAAQ